METFTLKVNDEQNLQFTGELWARVIHSSYTRQFYRWAELSIYQAANGKYIAHRVGYGYDGGRFRGKMCESLDEVMRFFGNDPLAES